jgi:hypothetical protein
VGTFKKIAGLASGHSVNLEKQVKSVYKEKSDQDSELKIYRKLKSIFGAVLVYLPGSAMGLELQAVDNKLTIIGNVQGKRYYENQPLKDINLKDQSYVIITPHSVDAAIIIDGKIPRIESKKGGPLYITFESIKISKNATLMDTLAAMFDVNNRIGQAYSRKFFVKLLEISGKKYENVFVKVEVNPEKRRDKAKFEYYYLNSKEPEHTQTEAIKQEIDQFIKLCTEQPDTATIDRTNLMLEKIEKLVSLKIKRLDKLRKSFLADKSDQQFNNIKEYFACKFKAQAYVDNFGLNPLEYKDAINKDVAKMCDNIALWYIPNPNITAAERDQYIEMDLKKIEDTYIQKQESASGKALIGLHYERNIIRLKIKEIELAVFSGISVNDLAKLENKIEEKFKANQKLFENSEKLRISKIPQMQLKAALTKLKKSLSELKAKLGQLSQKLKMLKEKMA